MSPSLFLFTSLVNLHVHAQFHCLNISSTPETPLLRRKGASCTLNRLLAERDLFPLASQFAAASQASDQETKQRRTSYLIATDQRLTSRPNHIPSDFVRANPDDLRSYDLHHEQSHKSRYDERLQHTEISSGHVSRSTPQHQAQAIRKLKNFFGEGVSRSSLEEGEVAYGLLSLRLLN